MTTMMRGDGSIGLVANDDQARSSKFLGRSSTEVTTWQVPDGTG
jgi:hypothetical protein